MEGNEYEGFENPETQRQRPGILSFVCVLSFINAVYNIIVNLIYYLGYHGFIRILNDDEGPLAKMADMYGDQWEKATESARAMFTSIDRVYYLFMALAYIGSFIGVRYMWKLMKKGLHFYAVSQILILIFSTIFMYNTIGGSPIFDLLTTALFILMYLPHYKRIMQ